MPTGDQASASISPAQERELFITFSEWLRLVLYIAIPLIVGIATIAVLTVQFLVSQRVEDLTRRFGDLERESAARLASLERDAARQLTDFERTTMETTIRIKASQAEAERAVSTATNSAEAAKALARTAAETAKASNAAAEAGRIALDQLNKDIANAGVARDAFGGAQRLVSILADKPEFIQRVSDTIKLQGAIVAFSRTTGCPIGWNLFDAAIGRTIVGATPPNWGGGAPLDQNGTPLTAKTLMSPAGVEGVYFSVSGYKGSDPPFSSPVIRAFDQKKSATQKDEYQGTDAGFTEIMPPYIPLYYCIKE
jgi:hypothetical protein